MKRSQDPAASPASSCPHHSLAVGAHQLFDWQEQERSLQEFIIPGYSRTVCTSLSLRQVRTLAKRRSKDKAAAGLGFSAFKTSSSFIGFGG